jgi:hypothetical protein
MCDCIICEKTAICTCVYCGLPLYCSPSCAALGYHPCAIARQLMLGKIPKKKPHMPFPERQILDRLFQLYLSQNVVQWLIEFGVRKNAFLCLLRHAETVYLWPHESLQRDQWLCKLAPKVNGIGFALPLAWSSNPEPYIELFSNYHSSVEGSDWLLESIDPKDVSKFIFGNFNTFLLLETIIKNCTISKCYHHFRYLAALTLPRRGILQLPPLHLSNFQQACEVAKCMKLPRGFRFLFDQRQWEYARWHYLEFHGRKWRILNLCKARNQFYLVQAPNFQNWKWANYDFGPDYT